MPVIAALLLLGMVLMFVVPITVLNGWAIKTLWAWFIVPTFHLSPLTITQAIGLALVVGMFKTPAPSQDGKHWEMLVTLAAAPFIAVAIGWVVRQWM